MFHTFCSNTGISKVPGERFPIWLKKPGFSDKCKIEAGEGLSFLGNGQFLIVIKDRSIYKHPNLIEVNNHYFFKLSSFGQTYKLTENPHKKIEIPMRLN